MVLGRFLFGVGGETLFVALLTGVGRWLIGPQLGVAMAIFFSVARVGSYVADLSPRLFSGLYQQSWQPPLLLSAAVAGVSFLAALGYAAIERQRLVEPRSPSLASSARLALVNPGRFVWGLLVLAMLFYAIVFPFRSTFAIEYFQGAKGLSLQEAGVTNSWVFFAAIFASPVCGWLSDRTRHKTQLLTVGMVSLAASFYILVATNWPLWASTLLVGLSYSLVPAVIWPAVSESVSELNLGATLGLMTVLQNIGMATVNFVVGWLNDQAGAGRDNPAGYAPMMWFFGALSLMGATLGVWLWKRTPAPRA
jgi:Na+/melibiose symporter-like transporter